MRHRVKGQEGLKELLDGEGVERMVLECWEQSHQMDSGKSLPLNLRGVYR